MLKKRKFSNFTKTTVETPSEQPRMQVEAPETNQFSIATKSAEIKSLLKKLQKQLEAFPADAEVEKFNAIKAALTLLEKHMKKPSVIEFVVFTLLKEVQILQKSPNYLTHRVFMVRKLGEIIHKVPFSSVESLIKILLNLVLSEKDNKIKAGLISCLVKIYKSAEESGQEIVLKEDILKEFLTIYPTLGFNEDVNKRALKLIMHMVIKDKTKLEAFSNLLFIEARKNHGLIGYFIKLVRKANLEMFDDDLLHLWAEILLELTLITKQLEDVQTDIIEFFADIFNKESMKDLREGIFCFYCESVRSFERKIKKKATEAIGKVTNMSKKTLLRTIKKEELDHYKNKKKSDRGEITTTDVSFTTENSEALALNRITGTFIFLLEDEFHEVRIGAIQSIRNLAGNFPDFAREVRDMMLNMLHDENDQVRIAALEALSNILKEISLGVFEKDLLLFNIKEDVFPLRVGIYRLMKIIQTNDQEILQQLISGILANVDNFIEDRVYIFESLRALIRNNPEIVENYISNHLLAQEERFLVQEPDWKSARHIGKMILLATAAAIIPGLAKSFPYYYEKHFSYLGDIYPDYFREAESVEASLPRPEAAQNQLSLILPSVPQNNFRVENIIFQEIISCFSKKVTVEQAVKILKNLEESFNSLLKGTTNSKNFLQKLLTVVQQYFKIVADLQGAYSLQAIFSKWKDNMLYEIFIHMISLSESYEIKGPGFEKLMNRLKFFFLSFSLSKMVNSGLMTKTIYQKKILEIGLFLFNNFNDKNMFDEIPGTQDILQTLENMVRNPGSILKTEFLSSLNKKLIALMKSMNLECEDIAQDITDLKRVSAEILEPSTNLEDSTEFHSQLFVKFNIIADIHNATGVEGICIGVKSQDDKVNMFKITQNDIILEEGQTETLKIRSTVHLDYGHWNRPSMIEIFLVKLLKPENGQLIHLLDNHTFITEVGNLLDGRFFVISNGIKLMIKPIH